MAQLSLEGTFLLSPWAEALVYGFLLCVFFANMYIHFTAGNYRDRHANVMIGISSLMFFIATWHLIMNVVRLKVGFVDHRLTPGGPAAYIGRLPPWDHVLKDTLYATQENFGSAAAIYRCWVLWAGNWWVILLPSILLGVNLVAGYMVCGLYTTIVGDKTVFDPVLNSWIKVFYSIAVALNIITTSLMGYRIWITHKSSSGYHTGSSRLIPVLRILVESAALQLMVEIVLLALYCEQINAQYIILECVASIVAITFNAITIRIKLHSMNAITHGSSNSNSGPNHIHTIGSMPMRRIRIDVGQDVENQFEVSASKPMSRYNAMS